MPLLQFYIKNTKQNSQKKKKNLRFSPFRGNSRMRGVPRKLHWKFQSPENHIESIPMMAGKQKISILDENFVWDLGFLSFILIFPFFLFWFLKKKKKNCSKEDNPKEKIRSPWSSLRKFFRAWKLAWLSKTTYSFFFFLFFNYYF